MEIVDSINTTFYSPDTAINSELLNPDYLIGKTTEFSNFFRSIDLPLVGNIINIIFFICAVVFLFIISYSAIRILEVRKKEKEYLQSKIEEYNNNHSEKEKRESEKNISPQRMRWNEVLRHLSSLSQGDWKLAIIDADSMLEDLLDQLGFKGDNLGEKLKSVDMEKYRALKSAWDAHIVRNQIAHEGISFMLSQQEAKRVIAIYESIFLEFRYI
jgi:hypothetical protein